jgi:hypothetical protein
MTRMRNRGRRRWLTVGAIGAGVLIVAIVIGAAVARRGGQEPPAGIRQWVAVLQVGADAPSLYASAADVGKVAGVYVFVDRWACYEGFPAGSRPSDDEWLLGIAARDRSVVDGIVAELGRTPLVEAEVVQGCAPPVDTTPIADQS